MTRYYDLTDPLLRNPQSAFSMTDCAPVLDKPGEHSYVLPRGSAFNDSYASHYACRVLGRIFRGSLRLTFEFDNSAQVAEFKQLCLMENQKLNQYKLAN